MLTPRNYRKGVTIKTVEVTGVEPDTATEDIIAVALPFAHETESSVWGARVERLDDDGEILAVVTIHID